MRIARILLTGTALVSSAAFAVADNESQAQPEAQSPSAQVLQESQARENPWFSQGGENPWSSAARSDSESAAPGELNEPGEATALAPSESDRPDASAPDPTRSETYAPPMGLGTDTYRT
jgi:hypothetical protein